jgi:hypothetical protein
MPQVLPMFYSLDYWSIVKCNLSDNDLATCFQLVIKFTLLNGFYTERHRRN